MNTVSPHIEAPAKASRKRKENFWEPIYNPRDHEDYKKRDWTFDHEKSFERCRFDTSLITNLTISKIVFSNCDFSGNAPKYTHFKNCTFALCDFGSSVWRHSKFSECTFDQTSISSSSFIDCEFRQCKWGKTGFSGNTTVLTGTVITNPKDFIASAVTGLNPKPGDETSDENHQRFRLEKTKATVARTLLKTLTLTGEEQTYYEAAKVADLQSLRARRVERQYNASYTIRKRSFYSLLKYVEWLYHYSIFFALLIETAIINSFGFINAWGASIFRVFLTGVFMLIGFSAVYYNIGYCKTYTDSLITGFDITLLIGYTKHETKDLPIHQQLLFASNGLLGLIWYAIVVPTIVNKISRVR